MTAQFVSYPKSGRTWIRYAFHLLGLESQVAWHHDGHEFNNAARPPHDENLDNRLARFKQAGPTVYLSREPRDVLVSGYHQITGRFADIFQYQGTLADYVRDPYFGALPLARFREQWAEVCRQGFAVHVTYEQCHADFARQLARVVQHLGFSVPEGARDEAVARSGFEAMRLVEQAGEFPHDWLQVRCDSNKVRQGRMGGYRDVLGPAELNYLDEVFGAPVVM